MAELDPISFRVLWGRLVGVVEEAGATLRHSAFSAIVSEGNDCTAVLFDAQGQEIAEPVSFTATSFIGTMPRSMKLFLKQVPPQAWREGDILVCNDPWICTGHLFDICLAAPIFLRGKLVAFSMTCAHTTNIGGAGRVEAQSVFEEGLRIPMCWLYRDGKPQETVFDFIRVNVPVPTQVLGDISAQVNANRTAARRVLEIMEELKLDDLTVVSAMIAKVCQSGMKKAILAIPTGKYEHALRVDGAGHDLMICTQLEVPGDGRLKISFNGTSKQIKSAINSPIHYTLARSFYALKAVLLPATPGNEATFDSVEVFVPPGTILNPDVPYPNAFRAVMGHFVPSAVIGVLSLAIPDRVIAEGAGPSWSLDAKGERADGERFTAHITMGCGQGGSKMRIGMDSVTYPGNAANQPIEVLERQTGFICEEKSLRRDSGGAGVHRGGWGQRIAYRMTNPTPIIMVAHAGRTAVPASGLSGGAPGKVGAISVNGVAVDISKQFTVRQGDLVVLETPGGGGWGA